MNSSGWAGSHAVLFLSSLWLSVSRYMRSVPYIQVCLLNDHHGSAHIDIIPTVDDGTGVIDCAQRHPVQAPPSPTKRSTTKVDSQTSTGTVMNKYQRPVKPPSNKVSAPEPPPPPKPIAEIGGSVRIVGRVLKKFETRTIYVDEIRKLFKIQEPFLNGAVQ